jgi:PAS domain S-box-containing protein
VTGGTWDLETQIRRADGEVRWIWARGRVQPVEKGQTARMVGTVMDITERKQAERRIARLASFPELSPYPIFEADLGGTITYVNPAARRRFPTLEDAGTAHPLLKDWSWVAESLKSAPEQTLMREVESDGLDYFQTLYYSPMLGVARSYFADITERKQAERALRASEKRWATTLQSIGDAVISTDASGNIEFMNEVAQRLTGWQWTEARGRELNEVFDIVHETTRIKPESPVAKVIRLGKVVGLANHTVLIGRGGRETPIDDSAAPIRDHEGRIEGVVLVFHDVTEQRLTEKALRESDRLATTGKLAATIAHEIHNPLDAVGNLLYLIGQESRDDTTREYASMASQELVRITQLTQQMLTFQREATQPVPVKIGDILENVIALYERKIKSAGIQLQQQVDFDKDILGLPGELRQMFANLLGNAIEAVGTRRGTITLRAYSSQDWWSRRPGLRVVVADNGPGIPAEVRAKIFEPFFTTKGESGTGLGLWIASDILRKYDGTIQLRSSTQGGYSGTCFSVFLPFEVRSPLPGFESK